MFRLKHLKARCGIRIAMVKGKPYEMGQQRGEQLADMVRAKMERALKFDMWARLIAKIPEEMEKRRAVADKFEDAINKKFPEIIDEFRGLADGAKVRYEDLKFALFGDIPTKYPYKDLMRPQIDSTGLPIEECSGFAATGPATADEHPIIAKNGDYSPNLREEDACLIYAEPAGGNRYIAVGAYPESFKSDGLNEKGLALCGSGVNIHNEAHEAYEKGKPIGVPLHHLQSVIYAQCNNVDDAIAYLKMSPRGYVGRNLNLVDTEGNILKAEISFEHINLIWPYENAMFAANWFVAGASHFASKAMNWISSTEEEYPSSYKRFDRYMELLTANAGKIDFDFAKRVIRDHKNGPGGWSICRHGPVYTLESYIIQPADGRVWCCVGHPCENEYEPFVIKKK